MAIRDLKLPQDLDVMAAIIPASFQYPENPEWSFAEDETEQAVKTLKTLKSFWPLISIVQIFSPSLRNILRGCIWEEDGQAVGLVNCMTRGSTTNWIIGNVAVLPEYRRRGIAQKLVQAVIDLIREENGETIILDVINKNIPAYNLYKKLGFEHFSGEVELQTRSISPASAKPLPNTKILPYDLNNWQPRFILAKAIAPTENLKYEPLKENTYKQPTAMRVLMPLINLAMGVKLTGEFVQPIGKDELTGWWRASLSTRKGGVNHLGARSIKGDQETAKYLVQSMLQAAYTTSPDRRTLLTLPQWQADLIQAALNQGFEKRIEFHRLGMVL